MGFSSYFLSLSLYIMSSYLMRYSVLHELNTLDAGRSWSMCGVIVVDAEDTDVMPICVIIALDIIITMRFSINCSTVICSPTVLFSFMREASSETYGPQVYFPYYTFRSINQKYQKYLAAIFLPLFYFSF